MFGVSIKQEQLGFNRSQDVKNGKESKNTAIVKF
jgi:hypothetical protein